MSSFPLSTFLPHPILPHIAEAKFRVASTITSASRPGGSQTRSKLGVDSASTHEPLGLSESQGSVALYLLPTSGSHVDALAHMYLVTTMLVYLARATFARQANVRASYSKVCSWAYRPTASLPIQTGADWRLAACVQRLSIGRAYRDYRYVGRSYISYLPYLTA